MHFSIALPRQSQLWDVGLLCESMGWGIQGQRGNGSLGRHSPAPSNPATKEMRNVRSTKCPHSGTLLTTACVLPQSSSTLTGVKVKSGHSYWSGWHLLASHPTITLSLLLLKKRKNKSEGMTIKAQWQGLLSCALLCAFPARSLSLNSVFPLQCWY